MKRELTISTAHTTNYDINKDKRIEIILEGGSPYFTYIWINDICYTIYLSPKNIVRLERTKSPR